MNDTINTQQCACAICALNIDFEMDAHLIQEIERHNCIVFAGAGISTEARSTHPNSFYDQMRFAIDCKDKLPFPEIVDRFEAQPNGRQKLIELIIDRFAYIDGFRELRETATRFHHQLATMPYLRTIVTTNWDRYFEQFCGATPFVYESDIPFWDVAKRPVLKIHGSIDNYASIVASSEDYGLCAERLRDGVIGAVLKQIFATKTCIFFGYSATDEDFLQIYNTVRSGLGQFARTHYLVSPYLTDSELERLTDLNIRGIKTDATFFLSVVKGHMVEKFCFSKDSSYDEILNLLVAVKDLHIDFVGSFRPYESPHLIYSTVYQDGLIHALERIIDQRNTGYYSDLHTVRQQIQGYERMIKKYSKERNYWEMAYFSGYQNGLSFFDIANTVKEDDLGWPPPYYHPGLGAIDLEDFEDRVRNNPEIHKAALIAAKRVIDRSGAASAEVVQHLPWAS